jgi:cell division protein FtsI (penicillin-binding protein 3)
VYAKKVGQKTLKILVIFSILLIICSVFILRLVYLNYSHKSHISTIIHKSSTILRGDIITKDGLTLSTSIKTYKIKYNPKYINENKKDTFATLLALYSGENIDFIKSKLNKAKNTTFLEIEYNEYHNYLRLNRIMDNLGIYKTTKGIRQRLEIEEKEKRIFIYSNVLAPYLGYLKKDKLIAKKGIESKYNNELENKNTYDIKYQRDVAFNPILNGNFKKLTKKHKNNIHLNILIKLQIYTEQILDKMKADLKADEIIASVIDSKTGKIITIASSNRLNPEFIRKGENISYLDIRALEYAFEPGSVMKPIILSFLLESKQLNKNTIFNGHEGIYKLGKRTIRDDHPAKWISAENAIIHSSNIALAQMGIMLKPKLFFYALDKFGFGRASGVDIGYEAKGITPSIKNLNREIRRATLSYGYGIQATFIQILKAYNVFNNKGIFLEPKIVNYISNQQGEIIKIKSKTNNQILSLKTTQTIKNILIKTVKKGTARGTNINGLEIGGKTGTARVVKDGVYIKEYISSFFGFANDTNNSYTIGVSVFNPKKTFYASQTAVPTFKKIVNLLVKEKLLIKEINTTN